MARLFGIFCLHEWEEEARAPLILRSRVTPSLTREVGLAVQLRCKCCGDVKIKKLAIDG